MKIIKKDIAVIVDAYSTGKNLSLLFAGNGFDCIHIIPSNKLNSVYMDRYKDLEKTFSKTYIYNDNFSELLSKLENYNIKCVISGSEAGVCLADKLNFTLNLHSSNSIHLSRARRDKYLMQKALSDNNIKAIKQIVSSDLGEIINFFNQIDSPIVIKPLSSSDAEGVAFCNNISTIETAFYNIINKKTQYGEVNEQVLIQKQMFGQEFIVNSVSLSGKHFITDVWSNVKKDISDQSLYDYQKLLEPGGSLYIRLTEYAKLVLDALEIRNGAAHCELILSEDEINLIEVGARLSGGFNPALTLDVFGYSQLSCLVDSYLRPQIFNEIISDTPALNGHAMIVSLISNASGKIKDTSFLDELINVPGFYCIQHDMNTAGFLEKTKDLTTSPGNIYLLTRDEKQLQESYKQIRFIEKTLYDSLIT